MRRPSWILATTLVATAFLGSREALAQGQSQPQQCDQRTKVLGHLAHKYKEAPVAVGVTNSGGLVEILTTNDGETWTIILSTPNGTSCLVAAGEGWRSLQFDDSRADPRV